ncbi:MAG: tetratricopeptide repeat protein [Treponema sp.]|nr:tetratricopeptide repeat protein [Treponema sp.]
MTITHRKYEEAFRTYIRVEKGKLEGASKEYGEYQCRAGICLLKNNPPELEVALHHLKEGVHDLKNPRLEYDVSFVTCCISLNQYKLAKGVCRKLVKEHPQDDYLHSLMAQCHAGMNEFNGAAQEYILAQKLKPRRKYAEELAKVYEQLNLVKLAEETRSRAKSMEE